MGERKAKDKRQFTKDFHIRPYWHVDLKWVFGILFAISLCVTVFNYGLFKITERDVAVDISAYAIATTFSANGLSDTTEINDIKDMIKASENGYIKPIEGLDITISLEDVEGKSPEDIRLGVFRRIAEPLYEGTDGIARITNNEEMAANILESQGLLSFFTRGMNLAFQSQLMIMSFVTLAFMTLTIFFSYGFGRVISPAVVALFVGIPNAATWGLLNLSTKNAKVTSLPFISGAEGGDKLTSSISEIVAKALPEISNVFYMSYGYLTISGALVLVAAALGKLILNSIKK